jgi:hypothetical protein
LVDGFLVSKQKINVNGLREIFAAVRKLLSRNIEFWCKGDFALGGSLAKDKTEVGLEL